MRKASSVKENSVAAKWVTPVIKGVIVGTIAILSLLLLFALVMSFKNIPQMFIPTLAVVAMAVGGFLSGFVAAKTARERGLLLGLLCGTLFSLIVLIAGTTVIRDSIGGLAFTKCLICLASAAIGGILGVNSKHKR